ncbi:hypothetical protein ABPG72_007872 [Tetrahymena utriculariae]
MDIINSDRKDLADKDKINFIAAFFHHLDVVFSIISIVIFFQHNNKSILGVALTLLILERIYLFFYIGVKTYKWSQAIMSLVFLDYIGEMCKSEEGRGMKLFLKKYLRVFLISSPYSLFCFFTFYKGFTASGLTLACGIIHILNTAQTNLEYYTQNILTIKAKQKIYIYTFIACEFFYRLVFLSFFRMMILQSGIIGYLIGEFCVNFLLELIICKKEGQEKSFWIQSTLQKGWAGIFYFRLEDTMVQDSDEWNSETRNLDNYRQQLRVLNKFKSSRSKLFIIFRLIENMFLTIVGIAQYADQKQDTGLFALAIILLPFYLIWHIKYCRFNFSNQQTSSNMNDSAVQGAVQSASNKYRDENNNNNHKPLHSEQNGNHHTPESNKYQQKDPYMQYPSEVTQQSDKKQVLQANQNNENGRNFGNFVNADSTPPVMHKKNYHSQPRNDFNRNVDHEIGQLNAKKSEEQQEQQLKKKYKSNPGNIENNKKQKNSIQKEQDYDDDDPYGQADINAFAIE